jgi:hypothetical protein
LCSCRRCRKVAGSIGAAANVLAEADTLEVTGEVTPTRYEHPTEPIVSTFCGRCGTQLLLEIPAFPQWVYPFASAIDTPLPRPPHFVFVRTAERPEWSPAIGSPDDPSFEANTEESMADWHARLGLETPD